MEQQNPLLQALSKSGYVNSQTVSFQHHDVFLDSEIGEPENYRELISLLFNANEGDSVSIFINSPGGHLDSAIAIVEGIKNTSAQVTGFVIGACHSAASIISMYCHQVMVMDNAYSLVHTASFGSSGNTNNVKSHTEFTVDMVEKLLNDAYEGFLTKEELAKVKTGVELWFTSEQIREKMENRGKVIAKKTQKKAKEIVEAMSLKDK
jgi:ATP-dependent protease ClpP protease subunit